MESHSAFARMGDLANYANLSRDQQESYMRSLDKWRTNMAVKAYDYSKGHAQGLAEGHAEGLIEGEKIGIEKGEKIGMKKGEEIGVAKGKIATAKSMKADGLPTTFIIKHTGLTEDEVNSL